MARALSFEVLGLMSEDADRSVQNIVDLTRSIIGAPISFISVLEHEKDRQFFAGFAGLPSELERERQTPLEFSICRLVQAAERTVVIPDLLMDVRTKDNYIVKSYGLRSYIGCPIHSVSGKVVGALCCMSIEPTTWAIDQIEKLERLALCMDDVIRLRTFAAEERNTELKVAKLLEARDEYIAHLSHEIRTPLTGIMGSIKLLKSLRLSGHPTRLIDILDRSANRLLDFVNNVLDVAKLDSNHLRAVSDVLDLGQLVNDICEPFSNLAESKSVSLTICDNLWGRKYMADKNAISTIVTNIVGNAVKFTENGSVEIILVEDSYGQVAFRVADTGIGIAPEFHSKIFKEYEQADTAISHIYGGTGLGMAIVKKIVQNIGGKINLESHIGMGTTFSVTLPLEAVDRPDHTCYDIADDASGRQSAAINCVDIHLSGC